MISLFTPFPTNKVTLSNSKDYADNNFKFDENGRKVSKRVENLREKEILLVMSNFSFSHSVFLILSQTSCCFSCVCSTSILKTLGKGEVAHNGQFLLFPLFSTLFFLNFLLYSSNLKLLSANFFSLDESKICHLGKG